MKKKEARSIAIDYLHSAAYNFYTLASKVAIDDSGTLSKDGYSEQDCDTIQVELDFIMKKVFALEFKEKLTTDHER